MAKRKTAKLESGDRPLTAEDRRRRQRVIDLVRSLPEAKSEPCGQRHMAMTVGPKKFAYYLNQHHDDGIICVCCKSTPTRQRELVGSDPQQFLVPAYLGKAGWVSVRLDLPKVNWDAVLSLLVAAYRAQAPKRLLRELE